MYIDSHIFRMAQSVNSVQTFFEYGLWASVINWCNTNQGFLSAILTIMTIVISVIAIRNSNRIGKMPYEKKIKVVPCYYHENGEPVIEVMVVNYGLITLVIDHLLIRDKKGEVVGSENTIYPIVLKPTESKKFEIHIDDRNGLMEKYALDLNGKMTIEIHEFGNEVTKFKKGFPVG